MNRQTFLTHLTIETHTLDVWLAQAWLVPRRDAAEVHFSDADLARARLIQHLDGGMGVNEAGIDVILHLLDQLHGVRQVLEGMKQGLGEASGSGGASPP